MSHFERPEVANYITEMADQENRRIADVFRTRRLQQGGGPSPAMPTAISRRAGCAMRRMPELLDMAAQNNVMEVREMLEVKGADPDYIHVREDTRSLSDSALVF